MFNWLKKKDAGKEAVVPVAASERMAAEMGVGVDPDSPWTAAASYMHNEKLSLQAQVRNWQRSSAMSWLISALAVGGVIYIGSQSKVQPYVVEVDKLGHTLAVRALDGNDVLHDTRRVLYREMIDFVQNCRSVSSDLAVNNDRVEKCLSRTTGAGYNYVRSELLARRPNVVAKEKTIEPKGIVALPVPGSERSWQVEWDEASYDLNGTVLDAKPVHWKAIIQYTMQPGTDEESLQKNSMGFTVPQISWVQQN